MQTSVLSHKPSGYCFVFQQLLCLATVVPRLAQACKVGGLWTGAPTSSIYGLEPPLLIDDSFSSLPLTSASWEGKSTSVKHSGDFLIRRSCLWQCLWGFGMKPGRSACWDCLAGLQWGRSKKVRKQRKARKEKGGCILSHWSNFSSEFFPVVLNTWWVT